MNYSHWGVITRPIPGGGVPGGWMDDDGVWHDEPAEPDSTLLYEGPGDFQDKGEAIETDSSGQPTLTSDASFYPKYERVINTIEPGDLLKVTYRDGTQVEGTVLRVRRLDSVIFVRRISATA